MSTRLDQYALTVRPLTKDEGGGYLCEFPELPGIMGDGETVESAIKDGRAALRGALKVFEEVGRPIPKPTAASGQWRMRAPRSLHRRLADRAKSEGVSLNTLAVSLIAEGLGRREGKRSAK
jgi:antitoxin HicB